MDFEIVASTLKLRPNPPQILQTYFGPKVRQ